MSRFILTRLLLFVIAVCGWALVGFGAWIGWRGVVLYARDPVLMGTGGGLAIGGLLVVALTLAARVQVATAETARDILRQLQSAPPRAPATTPLAAPPPSDAAAQKPVLPRLSAQGRTDPALTRR